MSVNFGDNTINPNIGNPTLEASIQKPSVNISFNAPAISAKGNGTILRELVNPQFFVGTVETLQPGEDVYCYLTGTKDDPVLNFGIPMGYTGADGADGQDGQNGADGADGITPTVAVTSITDGHNVAFSYGAGDPRNTDFDVMDGADGQNGQDGAAATIAVGTVTTGAAGSSATVTNSGTSSAAVFDFSIPKGDTGATGPQGPAGTMPYAVCGTEASTAQKEVTIASVTSLTTGLTVNIKFTNANSASAPTLKINSLDAKPIYQYGTTAVSTTAATTGWQAGAVVQLTYDGTGFVRDQGYNTNSTYTLAEVYCGTGATTAAKVSSNASYYVLRAGNIFEITFRYTNTKASALTLNVNSTGAKPIYIDGVASSATNYNIPAGKYTCYYDGTNYYINTNGKAPINITGKADGNHDIPSGGASGYVLKKSSATDYDVEWAAESGGGGGISDVTVNGTSVVTGGIAAVTVPTNTSDLNNDSGFVTSDTNVTQTAATPSSYTYWRPLLIGNSSNATEGYTPSTNTGGSYVFKTLEAQPSSGTIRMGTASMYNGSYTSKLSPDTLTADRTVTIPDKTGTMAMTSDIPELAPSGGSSPSTDVQYGSIGTSTYAAHADHRHPTNFPTTGTPADLGTASNGSAVTYARSDHVHNLPQKAISVTLASADWSSAGTDLYSQSVTSLSNVTSATKVDLSPDGTSILQMVADGTYAIYISNSSGTLTAYAVGAVPTANLTIGGVQYETL